MLPTFIGIAGITLGLLSIGITAANFYQRRRTQRRLNDAIAEIQQREAKKWRQTLHYLKQDLFVPWIKQEIRAGRIEFNEVSALLPSFEKKQHPDKQANSDISDAEMQSWVEDEINAGRIVIDGPPGIRGEPLFGLDTK